MKIVSFIFNGFIIDHRSCFGWVRVLLWCSFLTSQSFLLLPVDKMSDCGQAGSGSDSDSARRVNVQCLLGLSPKPEDILMVELDPDASVKRGAAQVQVARTADGKQ